MAESTACRHELSKAEVTDRLRALGVKTGGVLLVHTSFRAARPVEGGPLGLIASLRDALGEGGTLAMPSWSGDDDEPFDPMTSPAAPDLGVVADSFWRLPGVLRSNHPFACAAAGPEAARSSPIRCRFRPISAKAPSAAFTSWTGRCSFLGSIMARTPRCT